MKKYDPRPHNEKYGVCECEHFNFHHEIKWFGFDLGCCKNCMCPKYKKESELTFKEQHELEERKE